MQSVLYERACEFRAKRKYAEGLKLLKKGFEQGDIFCTLALHETYNYGGWGVETCHEMRKYVQDSKQYKHALSIMQDWTESKPVITNTHSSYLIYMHYLDTVDVEDYDWQHILKIAMSFYANAIFEICYHQFNKSLVCYGAEQKNLDCMRTLDVEWNTMSFSCMLIDTYLAIDHLHCIEKRLQKNPSKDELIYIGRLIYEDKITLSRVCGKNALKIFIDTNNRCKSVVMAWILVAKELKIVKDIYVLIGKMIWKDRDLE